MYLSSAGNIARARITLCVRTWACKRSSKLFYSVGLQKFLQGISKGAKPMKYIGKFCAVVVLTLSFTLPAYAGHIPCPGITDEPPSEEITAAGEMQNGITETVILIMLALV
jgi:hypothetical protein